MYIVDSANHTGYSQVREELNGSGATQKSYTIGLDIIGQTDTSGDRDTFLYDGHGSTRALVKNQALDTGQVFDYDAFGNRLDDSQQRTSILYSGEMTDASGMQYLRARYYDPATGRFNRLDPFAGRNGDPQSLHKYLYAHANPVMNVDPSGNVAFTIAGIGLGISAARSAQSRYNAGVAFAGRAALGFIADNLALVAWLRLSATARNGLAQFPQAQYEGDVHSNTNYVHIKGARITADQAFARILEFNRSDYQPGAPTQPLNSVGNIGDKLTWTMAQVPLNVGQADFDVRVDQLDRRRRFVSVVTLGGHPLSGFRFWEVRAASGNSNEFTIVTGAVEHNTTLADGFKANVGVGYDLIALVTLLMTYLPLRTTDIAYDVRCVGNASFAVLQVQVYSRRDSGSYLDRFRQLKQIRQFGDSSGLDTEGRTLTFFVTIRGEQVTCKKAHSVSATGFLYPTESGLYLTVQSATERSVFRLENGELVRSEKDYEEVGGDGPKIYTDYLEQKGWEQYVVSIPRSWGSTERIRFDGKPDLDEYQLTLQTLKPKTKDGLDNGLRITVDHHNNQVALLEMNCEKGSWITTCDESTETGPIPLLATDD